VISTVEKVLFLKSIDLFSQIPGEDLARVAMIASEVDFDPGESLMTEGEIGDSMYLILEGRVTVTKSGHDIAELGPRECVGEMAILDSEPRSATVRAFASTRALKVEREDFYELLDERMDIARGIIKVLCRRLRATTARGPATPSAS
jgi:CRP-like cAMP-binding protein